MYFRAYFIWTALLNDESTPKICKRIFDTLCINNKEEENSYEITINSGIWQVTLKGNGKRIKQEEWNKFIKRFTNIVYSKLRW